MDNFKTTAVPSNMNCTIVTPSFRDYEITIYDKDFNLKKIYKGKYHIIRHDSSIIDFEDEKAKLHSIHIKDGIVLIDEK